MQPFNPADLTLRRFDLEADASLLDAITELLRAAYWPLLEDGLRYLATHQDSATTLKRQAKSESYLGYLDGALIATITLETADKMGDCTWFQRPEVFKLAQFAVHPDHKGRGIGNHIMDVIEAPARELGAEELALDTSEHAHRLIALYNRRGYRQVDEIDWEVTNYKSVVLRKTL